MAIVPMLRNQPPDSDTPGGRLSRLRDSKGLTIAQVARRLGVKAKAVQDWESDRSEPAVEHLNLLAGMLDVSIVWLLHGVGDAPAHDIGPDPLLAIAGQLEKLKRMHADSGRIIERLTRELARLAEERDD